MTDLVLIAGPTASGKSALALALAAHLPLTIINADSMQIYRDLPLLSAQPSRAEMAGVPHALYGVIDAAGACSAARWRDLALDAIKAARGRGRLPVLVGGAGLYFRALLEGLAPVPDIPEAVRNAVRDRLADIGPGALHAELQRLDPAMAARLQPGDGQRIARAFEVFEATGRSLLAFQQADTADGAPAGRAIVKAVVELPRDLLYARINARFEAMVAAGALDEVKRLKARKLNPLLPAMKALGVPSLIAALEGEMTIAAAIADAALKSRRYAKRQMTWMRTQCADWLRLDGERPDAALETLRAAIDR